MGSELSALDREHCERFGIDHATWAEGKRTGAPMQTRSGTMMYSQPVDGVNAREVSPKRAPSAPAAPDLNALSDDDAVATLAALGPAARTAALGGLRLNEHDTRAARRIGVEPDAMLAGKRERLAQRAERAGVRS